MLTKLFLRSAILLQNRLKQGEFFLGFSFAFKAFFDSKQKASAVFNALKPELSNRHEKNAVTKIDCVQNVLEIRVFSSDKKHLKASINSYLKLFELSVKSLEVI